jgi:WD40 repeat protein
MTRQVIFISYAHKDATQLASRLESDLAKNDYEVWLDRSRLSVGRIWSQDIERAIDRADVVLALLSAGSYDSEVCRGEQLRGLRLHKCVIPVRVQRGTDIPVFLEARQYCDLSDEAQYEAGFQQLIHAVDQGAETALAEQFRDTPYDTVPPLPTSFSPREKELRALRALILNEPENRKLALVALRGMAGLGKTVLAQALCQDQAIKDAFPIGIVWIKLGEKPSDAELIEQMREAMRALGAQPEHFDSPARASNALRTLLQNKAALLVLDDVWQASHVALFQPNDPRCCRLLLTTRSVDIVAATRAREYALELLGEEQSRELLASCAGRAADSLPAASQGLVQACEGLPLAIAIVGGMLYGEPETRWQDVLDNLCGANLDGLALEFPTYKYPSLVAAFNSSIESLEPPQARQNYLDLAVLPKDTPAPAEALAVLWNTTPDAAGTTMSRFVRRSLASYDGAGHLVLHDLLLEYTRARSAGNIAALHQRFLDSYRQRCSDGWRSGPKDGYFFEQLAYHLKHAGRHEELTRVLLDFSWMQARLEATNIAGLLSDYEWAQPDNRATRLVQESILLSAYVIAEHRDQLAGHLLGRLQGDVDPAVAALLDQIRGAMRTGFWLRPLSASLIPPGGPLLRTLAGQGGWLEAIAVPAGMPDQAITSSSPPLSGPSLLEVWDLRSGIVTRSLPVKRGKITGLASTSDGRLAVTSGRTPIDLFGPRSFLDRDESRGPDDGNVVTIWELGAEKVRHVLTGHSAALTAIALTPDDRFAISASRDKTLIVWDIWSGQRIRTLVGHVGTVADVAVTPDGRQAVSVGDRDDPTVRVWDLESGSVVRVLRANTVGFTAVTVSPDGRHIIAAAKDKTLTVWDASGVVRHVLRGHTDEIHDVVVTRDSRLLLSAAGERVYSEDKSIKVWDLGTGVLVRTLTGHEHLVSGLAAPADNRSLLSVSLDGTLRRWDVLRRKDSLATRHSDAINALAVLDDGRLAVSASNDRTLKIWKPESGELLRTLSGHTSSVEQLALDSVRRRAVSVSGNFASGASGELILWDLDSGNPIRTWNVEGYARALTITPDGRLAIAAGSKRELMVVDLEGADGLVRRLSGHDGEVFCLAATPDSRWVLSGAGDGSVRIWALDGSSANRILRAKSGDVRALALTPDGRFAVSGSGDKTVKVWDLSKLEEVCTLKGHGTIVNDVTASADGKLVLSSSGDGTLILWRTESWSVLAKYDGGSTIYDQTITPDGRLVAAAGVDGTFNVWDVETGRQATSFRAEGGINACACSPDSRTFVAGDRAGGVHFLRLE